MVDDCGYKALFVSIDKTAVCIELACLVHARCKFFDCHHAHQSPMAFEALQRIGKLNGLNPADWLKDTLEKLPSWPNSYIDELLLLALNDFDAIKQKLFEKAKW